MNKKKVTFLVDEDLYCEYKKVLIDKRTNPTADFKRHMQNVVDNHYPSKTEEDIPIGPGKEE